MQGRRGKSTVTIAVCVDTVNSIGIVKIGRKLW